MLDFIQRSEKTVRKRTGKYQFYYLLLVQNNYIPVSSIINGRHTEWSWKVVLKSWTDRLKECKQRTEANLISLFSSPSPSTTLSIRHFVSIILLRISSSLAAKEANALEYQVYLV